MNDVWLIGSGSMAVEYAKVLAALGETFVAIGRGDESAKRFRDSSGHEALTGGLGRFLGTKPDLPKAAIVCVGVPDLASATTALLNYGVGQILVEKPGVASPDQIDELDSLVDKRGAQVFLAYNRRFFASTRHAETIIKSDGGVSSFHFEFTEWAHTIAPLKKTLIEFQHWMLANSSHVIDLAFFLGGSPSKMECFQSGAAQLEWHPSGAVYSGAGMADTGALFSYQANWLAPGRWSIEILTRKHRIYLKPMEELQIQEIGSVAVNPMAIDDQVDLDFKPGLYHQAKAFLGGDFTRFCSVKQQRLQIWDIFCPISGYRVPDEVGT